MPLNAQGIYTYPLNKKETNFPLDNLAGVYAQDINELVKNSILFPNSFALTTDAFDDFIITNHLVEPINEQLDKIKEPDFTLAGKISSSVQKLLNNAVFPSHLHEILISEYSNLGRSLSTTVHVTSSWLPKLDKLKGSNTRSYDTDFVSGIMNLETAIIKTWMALFDTDALVSRAKNGFDSTLSIATVISNVLSPEISGRASSYNPLTMNQNECEIEAVYGVLEALSEVEIMPDRYVIIADNLRIIEKNTNVQNVMTVVGNVNAQDQRPLIQIEVSRPWRLRQKLNDSLIQDLATDVISAKKILGKNIDCRWALEAGKLYLTKLFDVQEINFDDRLTFQEKTINGNKLEVEVNPQSTKKTVENYVKEVERELREINADYSSLKSNNKFEPIVGIAGSFETKDTDLPNETTQNNLKKEYASIKPVETFSKELPSNLWPKLIFSPSGKQDKGIVDIWLDVNGEAYLGELNSDEFDGLYGLTGEYFLQYFGGVGALLREPGEEFINFVSNALFAIASQDRLKDMIYSISLPSREEGEALTGSPIEGLAIHEANQELLGMEIEALKRLRNKLGYRRVSIGIRGVKQVDNLRAIKRDIASFGLHRSSNMKIFLEVDTVPSFMNVSEYMGELIDGVVLHFDAIIESLLGHKVSESGIYKHKVFWQMLENFTKEVHKRGENLIIKFPSFKKYEKLLGHVIKLGVNGVTSSPREVSDTRRKLLKLELDALKRR